MFRYFHPVFVYKRWRLGLVGMHHTHCKIRYILIDSLALCNGIPTARHLHHHLLLKDNANSFNMPAPPTSPQFFYPKATAAHDLHCVAFLRRIDVVNRG
jgi:hypothetical protein